jgi:drug/metabolite transporter (DMT)-like permease
MSFFALVLVLAAAFFHATWNLLAKRAGSEGAVFVWLFGSLSTLLYAPLVVGVVLVQRPALGTVELGFMLGSGVLHTGYFLLLQKGYSAGDLSVVYPLARGTSPLLATVAAVAFLGERPSLPALLGVLLIAGGVYLISGGPGGVPASGRGAVYGLLTGVFIAAYTLWDARAVSVLLIPPLLQSWTAGAAQAAMLAPYALRRWDKVRGIWRAHRSAVLGIAVLMPLSYILVLTALVFTPVSYVAPAREVSVLIAVLMGARLLSEGDLPRRMLAAGAMVVGVTALATG